MVLAIGVEIRIFCEIATQTLFNRMHHMHLVVKLEIRARDIWPVSYTHLTLPTKLEV